MAKNDTIQGINAMERVIAKMTEEMNSVYCSTEESEFLSAVIELEEDILSSYGIYPEFSQEEPGYHSQQYAIHQVRAQQGYDTEW